MTYSTEQLAHISRLEARLESNDVKGAYRAIMDWSETRERLFLFPVSQGAFSAIHIATHPDAVPYGECEFAFKGAKAHIRWWFRKPCFAKGLCDSDGVLEMFPSAEMLTSGEVAMNLHDIADVDRLCSFLDLKL